MPGDSQVEVMVIDQGQGFAAEVRGTAFDRFVRAEESRNRDAGGSGLGLTIAKGIIEAHGGDIEILGGPGGRVRFALPVGPTLSN
jgi:two-component system OmpR family sensor kinase